MQVFGSGAGIRYPETMAHLRAAASMHEAHAAVVVPAGHVARIGMVEMIGAGEAARHRSAHLRLHRGEVFWCQRAGLGKLNPSLAANHGS